MFMYVFPVGMVLSMCVNIMVMSYASPLFSLTWLLTHG